MAWKDILYIYDGTFEGFLCCVFMSYTEKENPVDITSQGMPPRQGTLYLKLPTEEGTLFPKIRAILNMFPGDNSVVVYFADTKVRRGSCCTIDERMLKELRNVLGEDCVVVK